MLRSGALCFNPENWDRWLAEQPRSTNIEDRRKRQREEDEK
jgi:hypothetical protein